ncbi:MAG: RHS repeat-associated core domain-containing protein, partial [Aminipila sp.]
YRKDPEITYYTLDRNQEHTVVLQANGESNVYANEGIVLSGEDKQVVGLNGSVIAEVDEDEEITTHSYSDYGVSNTKEEGHAYNGEYVQSNGLIYLRARYYDPTIGNFIQIDNNYAGEAENVATQNRYNYTLSNPYKYVDRDGNSWASDMVKKYGHLSKEEFEKKIKKGNAIQIIEAMALYFAEQTKKMLEDIKNKNSNSTNNTNNNTTPNPDNDKSGSDDVNSSTNQTFYDIIDCREANTLPYSGVSSGGTRSYYASVTISSNYLYTEDTLFLRELDYSKGILTKDVVLNVLEIPDWIQAYTEGGPAYLLYSIGLSQESTAPSMAANAYENFVLNTGAKYISYMKWNKMEKIVTLGGLPIFSSDWVYTTAETYSLTKDGKKGSFVHSKTQSNPATSIIHHPKWFDDKDLVEEVVKNYLKTNYIDPYPKYKYLNEKGLDGKTVQYAVIKNYELLFY